MIAMAIGDELLDEIVELLRCAADIDSRVRRVARENYFNYLEGVKLDFGPRLVHNVRSLILRAWQQRREFSDFQAFLLECALRLERGEWWTR